MVRPRDSKFDAYAKHRILHRILEMFPDYVTWERMAAAVSDDMATEFPRPYFNRIRKFEAGDQVLETIVRWIETKDAKFRETLKPDSIFSEVGASSRDYYFHLYQLDDLDEWDEALLQEFEGVYLCAPDRDANSYMPLSRVRRVLLDKEALPKNWRTERSVDWRAYISKRSFLVLKRTDRYHYWAAEIPYGALYPDDFQTMDITSYYEGVGIASSNTIHVFLRECLARVPKFHSIMIKPKAEHKTFPTRAGNLYADTSIRYIDAEFAMLTDDDIEHMKREFEWSLQADVLLRGTVQSNISPLHMTHNMVGTIYGEDKVYHRKPLGFLNDPETHFFHPKIDITPQLERVLSNPLLIGEFLAERRA